MISNTTIAEILPAIDSGLFCSHLVRVFAHLGLEKIPAKYVLRRYTIYAVLDDVPFDRQDKVFTGPGGIQPSVAQGTYCRTCSNFRGQQ